MLFNSTLCMIACCEVKKDIAIIVIVKPHYTYVASLMLCSDSSHTTYFFVDEILGQQFRLIKKSEDTDSIIYIKFSEHPLASHSHKRKRSPQEKVYMSIYSDQLVIIHNNC